MKKCFSTFLFIFHKINRGGERDTRIIKIYFSFNVRVYCSHPNPHCEKLSFMILRKTEFSFFEKELRGLSDTGRAGIRSLRVRIV